MSADSRTPELAGAVPPSRILRSRTVRAATHWLAGMLNPAIALLAGTRWLPLFGILLHTGRRSGREYRTPVVMLAYAGGLIIPLTFGAHANWYRNVMAAGTCRARWRGAEISLTSPVVIEAVQVRAGLPLILRGMLVAMGMGHFLRLSSAV